ncbi:MAG: ferredoxin [Bacteroidales bacterium]|jgi:electron transport complex protein RnfB|nr:ferredoxin [Bacteroidales bacterium]
MAKDKAKFTRRDFINRGARITLGLSLAGVGTLAATKASGEKYVWQIDPSKCTQCGRCATDCVLAPSAVKCVHAYDLCGYCDLCGGYFKPGVTDLQTGAEKQLCPAAAIERKYIEEPYFEYVINEDLCIGCAKCVKGCSAFGNGSLHLQIRHDLCVNCNECAIARVCPSDAISRVPASQPYIIKGNFSEEGGAETV